MAESTRRRGSADSAYLVRFGLTALILVAGTLILVLVVLPQRYVLSAGFREAGTNFPDPSVPFARTEPVRVAANPSASVRPPFVTTPTDTAAPPEAVPPEPGPAELLWSRVLPLIEAGRYDEALRLFEEYLEKYPGDRGVRREYANTLTLAGRPDEAVSILRALLDERDDPAIRLMLARTLRDMGDVEAAAAEYAILAERFPDDQGLVLEWAKALAWGERYGEAAELLEDALRRWPDSVPLKVELARVYYSADRLEEGRALLAGLSPGELREAGAATLLADIDAALFEPEADPPYVEPEATLLEQAVAAREADDLDRAADLFRRALAEHPDDPAIWKAYADFLEYERGDFEGARNALLEVERLGAADAAIRYRLALLDSWTGRNAEGIARLEALLDDLESPPSGQAAETEVTPAAVRALLGDLERWEGDRIAAARSYEEALDEDPEEPRARDGMEALHAEVAAVIEDEESPRLGSFAYGLGDTDEYDRFDVAGEWIGIEDQWVWAGTVGRRWVGGPDVAGSTLQGMFLELAPARWWRWGTVRTSARLGAQWLRPDEVDVAVAASALYRSPSDAGTVEVEVAHEPAYALTATLQSAIVGLDETRVRAALDEPLGERWSVAVEGGLSRISAPESLVDSEASTRLSGTVSLSRSLTPSWSLGVTTQALTYTGAAPTVGGLRLYWDPNLAWTTGPFVRFASDLERGWSASFTVNPGVGLIDERDGTGTEAVPQLSAVGGLAYETAKFRTSFDLFYGLARLEGYRTYGARISLSAGRPSGGTSP